MKIMKKQSEVLQVAIDRLEGLAEVNREYMDADDYGALQVTIKELTFMKAEAVHTEYQNQIVSFVEYLQGTLGNTTDDEDGWNKWCQTPYTITHGDKSVTIDNTADFYDGLVGLLLEHLEGLN